MGGGRARRGRRQRRRSQRCSTGSTRSTSSTGRPGSTTTRPAGSRERLGVDPKRQHYSGIGGTTPQLLVQNLAEQILRSELDVALVVGAEALDTQKRFKKRGERYPYSFKPDEKRPFPWEAPFHPAEVAHEVFQAWLTFAIFDNARRAHLGDRARRVPDAARRAVGALHAGRRGEPGSVVPDRAVGRRRSSPPTPTTAWSATRTRSTWCRSWTSTWRLPCCSTSHEAADALGVPADRRVYLRGWCYATDPIYVAEHVDLWQSPAMEHAAATALGAAGVGIDDVAHLDLYSCFASSVNFARDALGHRGRRSAPADRHRRPAVPRRCRAATTSPTRSRRWRGCCATIPGSFGLVSGVGHAHDEARLRRLLHRARAERARRRPGRRPSSPRSRSRTPTRARRRSRRTRSCTGATARRSGASRSAT